VLGSGALALLVPKCPWCLLAYASLLGVTLDPLATLTVLGSLLALAPLLVLLSLRARAARLVTSVRGRVG
jgi:hypothetical protein